MSDTRRVEAGEKARGQRYWRSDAGFSLVEMLVGCLIIGIATGIAIITITSILPTLHADSSLDLVVAQLRQAREQAMDQTQNFTVTFTAPNEITVTSQGLHGNIQPAVYFLGEGMIYTVLTGVPDTPDGPPGSIECGNSMAVNLDGGNTVTFQGDGTVLSSIGQLGNGTVCMATPGNPITARAVTIMGATGHIQGYRYNGTKWN